MRRILGIRMKVKKTVKVKVLQVEKGKGLRKEEGERKKLGRIQNTEKMG